MDVKDKIKKAIEQNGVDLEKLQDLFSQLGKVSEHRRHGQDP